MRRSSSDKEMKMTIYKIIRRYTTGQESELRDCRGNVQIWSDRSGAMRETRRLNLIVRLNAPYRLEVIAEDA
jgi:hypothetical protein